MVDPPTINSAMLQRVSNLGSGDAVEMQLRAQKHRRVADRLEGEGDRVAPRFERAEARRLERTAELALDPVMHATGPVAVGNGGEMAIGTPYTDIVRERPDMLAIDAARQRMELANKADALLLSLDAANSVQPQNALEKMLIQEMAAAHVAAMELQAEARALLQRYKRTGFQQLNVEAGRTFNCAARMMSAYQDGMLTLTKARNNGQQTIVIQRMTVSDGGRGAMVGQVKLRGKEGHRKQPKGEGEDKK